MKFLSNPFQFNERKLHDIKAVVVHAESRESTAVLHLHTTTIRLFVCLSSYLPRLVTLEGESYERKRNVVKRM